MDRIYIFDVEGNYEDRSNSLIPYLIEEDLFFTLLPYKIENSYYYFVIGYVYQNYIHLTYYNYKFLGILETNFNKIYSVNTDLYFSISEYKVYGKPISCELLKYDDNPGDTFTCGYYGIVNDKKYFLFGFFMIRDNYLTIKDKPFFGHSEYYESEIVGIRSSSTTDHLMTIFCFFLSSGKTKCYQLRWYNFYINHILFNVDCLTKYYGLKVDYHEDKDEYTVSCLAETLVGGIQVVRCTGDLQHSYRTRIFKYGRCEYISGYSLIYNINKNNYYIISDVKCNNKNYPFQPLIGNSTEDEEEVYECIELEKCKLCDNQSISNNLCIKCDNEKGFFYLNEQLDSKLSNNKYIDCVNNSTKPSNFYFDEENQEYRSCFQTCNTCYYGGNVIENNCTSCINGFIINPDINNSTNCIQDCKYYSYIYYLIVLNLIVH